MSNENKIKIIDDLLDRMKIYYDQDVMYYEEAGKKLKRFDWTLKLFKVYRGNPLEFSFLINVEVWKYYKFEEAYNQEDPGLLWGPIENMVTDMVWERKFFKVFHTGVFSGVAFSDKKRVKFQAEFEKHILELSEEKEWSI